MTRNEAIDILARHDLARLSPEMRERHLLDWWWIDDDDPEYASLSEELKAAIAQGEGPDDPLDHRYDPILRLALSYSLTGVTNAYLEGRLAKLGILRSVEGTLEPLEACLCCGYRSIQERGNYEICKVCFWEDDGGSDPDRVSSANHMTLRAARESFERIGAVAESMVKHVLPDGKERYERDRS